MAVPPFSERDQDSKRENGIHWLWRTKPIKNLSELYGSIGYIYVFIEPEKVVDDVTKKVSIHFNIVEGKQAFLNRLEFVGNFRTKDRVLRRNFAIAEGEIFNISR